MSKEEFLKIQTCVLKVNIHCDGCRQKVKKILQKIEGVFTTKIESEIGKVTVSGNIDPAILIKKLIKAGKHAELWGAPRDNNKQKLNNQLKNLQIHNNGKGGNNNNQKVQKQKGGGGVNNLPKGGGPQGKNHHQHPQQMKGSQEMKLPQFNDLKLPSKDQSHANNHKIAKFLSEDDDEFSDEFDDDDAFEDGDDDDMDDPASKPQPPNNKMKPTVGPGPGQCCMPNMMMLNGMMGGNHHQLLNSMNAVNRNCNNDASNISKRGIGGGGSGAVLVHGTGNGNNNGKQNQGSGKGSGKSGGASGGATANNPSNANAIMKDSGGGGLPKVGGGLPPNMYRPNCMMNETGGINNPMGQKGDHAAGQMSNFRAVQDLPVASMGKPGGGDGHSSAAMAGNPYQQGQQQQQQQPYLVSVINQQQTMGSERFQPVMYAQPPPAVNYMPLPHPNMNLYPYAYPYSYPPPDG
ncbi:hypothetical protein SAY87_022311 [Trapa incisa]|uniref:HMA domain-containing protein n=1 Tax=Trapa incisa TaxID=236973 RepID=A0AAN7K1M4_9MYRT|nr:hypothetical protein SAY87_022311 [Trapa incisa]